MSPIKDSMFGGPAAAGGEAPQEDAPKKKRRSKQEMIDDAVIPGSQDMVKVKFTASETKGERTWEKAVELFREKKIEFIEASLKYAVMKMDQQAAGAGDGGTSTRNDVAEKIIALTAQWLDVQKRIDEASDDEAIRQLSEESDKVRAEISELGGQDPSSDEAYARRAQGEFTPGKLVGKRGEEFVPENAMTGDEIITGSKATGDEETYYVGHGHVLMAEPPMHEDKPAIAGARWFKHEGAWRSVELVEGDAQAEEPEEAPTTIAEGIAMSGSGQALVERETVGKTAEPVMVNGIQTGLWKVSMGYLEKIGLPEYSSLQIGPCSAQTHVLDDGRRTKVVMHGREVELPTAVIEMQQQAGQICEYSMRAERQSMINFLEAVKPGSTKPE